MAALYPYDPFGAETLRPVLLQVRAARTILPLMERPANISPEAWSLLQQHVSDHPGIHLIVAGWLSRPELLRGVIVELPVGDGSVDCLIDEEAAAQIASDAEHIRLTGIGDRKEYLVPLGDVLSAVQDGNVDYLEEYPSA